MFCCYYLSFSVPKIDAKYSAMANNPRSSTKFYKLNRLHHNACLSLSEAVSRCNRQEALALDQ